MESMSSHDPFMHNAFWHENQVCITLQLSPEYGPSQGINQEANAPGEVESILARFRGDQQGPFPPTFPKGPVIAAMQLPILRDDLASSGYHLTSFTISQTLQPEPVHKQPEGDIQRGEVAASETEDDINSEVGKYLFATRDKEQGFVPTLICFFNFMKGDMASSSAAPTLADLPYMFEMATSPAGRPSMPEMGSMSAGDKKHDQQGNDQSNNNNGGGNGEGNAISPVVDLVKLINTEGKLKALRDQGIPIVAASPIWFAGGTQSDGPKPQGCPLTPPIPVSEDVGCSSYPGLFPITLPDLPTILQHMTGDGVTVFVLDTLPRRAEIHRAVEAAEKRNLLLLDVAENVKFHHNRLPVSLEEPGPLYPATGKDINGKLIGFRMPDHGLFVAGIIRDLAPDAHIECVRVLNDYCVGDLPTLSKSLETIQGRMSLQGPDNLLGDLAGKPVVINMSLVIPADSELLGQGFDASDLAYLRKELLLPIEGLAESGVMFVASAGNEGDLRYPPANPDGIRPEALYPAAFAYDTFMKYPYMMIPVGAVDKRGKAASYSCYPGEHGIGTYGGEVPKPSRKKRDNCYTRVRKIDAPIGLYTAISYPSLSVDDCEPSYPEPNADAWAYWVGTSFATPIIAAVVARILEYIIRHAPPGIILTPNTHVWRGLTEFAVQGHTVTWDRIGATKETKDGPMLLAVQKQCVDDDDE